MFRWKMGIVTLLLLFVAAGCAGGKVEVSDVWGRTAPMEAENAAFYLTIVNNTREDDQLLSAAADVCGTAELHETIIDENDVMMMQPVTDGSIDVPAGQTVELKVGGLHVMCIGKTREFSVGEQIPLTLTFAKAGEMQVTAEIREAMEQ